MRILCGAGTHHEGVVFVFLLDQLVTQLLRNSLELLGFLLPAGGDVRTLGGGCILGQCQVLLGERLNTLNGLQCAPWG